MTRWWTEWTIAIAFLREGRLQTFMITIGVAVGVAVIVFVTALIQGLQANVIDRTLGTQAHIRLLMPDQDNIRAPLQSQTIELIQEDKRAQRLRSIDNWQGLLPALDARSELTAVSPLVSGPALAQRGEAVESIALVGVDLERYTKIIPLADYIVAGQLRLGADDALIGTLLADDLGVRAGSKIRLDTGQQNGRVVNVVGIFELGVRELDERYVYMDLKQAQPLLDLIGGVTVIDLKVANIFTAEGIAQRIGRMTGLRAESWMATNAQLMNALSAQSLSTNMISFFVGISVALGIASVLSVTVVQRTREIGILRATGAKQGQILRVFLMQGALFGLIGSIFGIVASYALVWIFNTFGPGLFYIPIPPVLVVLAVTTASLTGIVAAVIPARRAARLDPVVAIRYV
jgi:lipoprotein-releasing system permease protein